MQNAYKSIPGLSKNKNNLRIIIELTKYVRKSNIKFIFVLIVKVNGRDYRHKNSYKNKIVIWLEYLKLLIQMWHTKRGLY